SLCFVCPLCFLQAVQPVLSFSVAPLTLRDAYGSAVLFLQLPPFRGRCPRLSTFCPFRAKNSGIGFCKSPYPRLVFSSASYASSASSASFVSFGIVSRPGAFTAVKAKRPRQG